jgi:hypothetical protein
MGYEHTCHHSNLYRNVLTKSRTRIGVLVAVNAAAHQIAPDLPVADAHEQFIAQSLHSQVSGGS